MEVECSNYIKLQNVKLQNVYHLYIVYHIVKKQSICVNK